jgi:Di-haem oxidoreductase, putative peroxidase
MALARRTLERLAPLHGFLLGAGLLAGCQNLPDDPSTGTNLPPEAKPIITANSDFTLITNTTAPVKVGCTMQSILNLPDTPGTGNNPRLTAAFDCGDALFSDVFNEVDGSGARVGQGRRFTRFPRADLNGPGEWATHTPQRVTGPNAQSCADCHQAPGDGAGGIATHAVRDPNRSGIVSQFIERQTPHLFGMAATQLLAEEITADLQTQLASARAKLVNGVTSVQQAFTSKGINFGTGTVTATSVIGLTNIDPDLVVKPFQWKGSVAFTRDFVRGAAHNEIGMQGIEMVGQNIDGDGDGVANELGIGDMTAFAAYMATQVRPVSKLELNALGQLTPALSTTDIASINRGSTVFVQAMCSTCHVPQLTITNAVFTEPSQSPFHRDGATFPDGFLNPISVGVDPRNPISANLITDMIDNRNFVFTAACTAGTVNGNIPCGGDNLGGLQSLRSTTTPFARVGNSAIARPFTDFRRHFMGANLAEQVDDGVPAAVWFSRTLWGVGSTAPYMHDGRAPTLMSAILEHANATDTPASDAAPSIALVRTLGLQDQTDLINFLKSLVLFLPE